MGRTRSDIAPRIIEAARERFLVEGVDGAALRAIAADAGTSIGMVYYYFPTKDDLFLAVVEDTYAVLLADLATALAPDAEVETRLRRLYHRLGAMTERELVIVRLLLREALVSNARLERIVERFRRGHIPLVLQAISDGIADGTLVDDVPPVLLALATFTVGVAPQVILRRAGKHLPHASGLPREVGDLLLRIMLDGLRPRSRRVVTARRARAPARARRRTKR